MCPCLGGSGDHWPHGSGHGQTTTEQRYSGLELLNPHVWYMVYGYIFVTLLHMFSIVSMFDFLGFICVVVALTRCWNIKLILSSWPFRDVALRNKRILICSHLDGDGYFLDVAAVITRCPNNKFAITFSLDVFFYFDWDRDGDWKLFSDVAIACFWL